MPPPEMNSEVIQPEIIQVENQILTCDGGDGPLGHPLVYLNMEGKAQIDCPYCGRRFVLKDGAGRGNHA